MTVPYFLHTLGDLVSVHCDGLSEHLLWFLKTAGHTDGRGHVQESFPQALQSLGITLFFFFGSLILFYFLIITHLKK